MIYFVLPVFSASSLLSSSPLSLASLPTFPFPFHPLTRPHLFFSCFCSQANPQIQRDGHGNVSFLFCAGNYLLRMFIKNGLLLSGDPLIMAEVGCPEQNGMEIELVKIHQAQHSNQGLGAGGAQVGGNTLAA